MPKEQKTSFAEPLQQVDRTYVLSRGRKLTYFGGCDYLRLSSHPTILQAVETGLRRYGLNVAASRKTTGNHILYEQIEAATARFFAADCARLVSNGYLTNIVAAQALRGVISHVLIDERAHSSLQDAALFLQGRVTTFKHRNARDAAKKLARLKGAVRVALLTDGLFAHNGSFAPLREYRQLFGSKVLLWIDDSHAAGVVGANGQGSLEAAGLNRHNTLQTITFSKAFGVYGGAILCDEALGERIVEHSSAMVGNTPLPLPLASGVLAALKLAGAAPRLKLQKNIELFWREIVAQVSKPAVSRASKPARRSNFEQHPVISCAAGSEAGDTAGLETCATPLAPIIAFVPADPEQVRAELLQKKIYPSHIRYPGGPAQGYYRFAISSEHTTAQITSLARILAQAEVLPG